MSDNPGTWELVTCVTPDSKVPQTTLQLHSVGGFSFRGPCVDEVRGLIRKDKENDLFTSSKETFYSSKPGISVVYCKNI